MHVIVVIAAYTKCSVKVNKLVFKTKINLKGVWIDHCNKKEGNKEHTIASYSETT